jgi:hypothetical protein
VNLYNYWVICSTKSEILLILFNHFVDFWDQILIVVCPHSLTLLCSNGREGAPKSVTDTYSIITILQFIKVF